MKSLIASISILLFVVIITVFGVTSLFSALHGIESKISDIDTDADTFDEMYEKALSAEEYYSKHKLVLDIFMDDKDKQSIDIYIQDIKSASQAESIEGVLIAKNRLISETEEMKRSFALNIDSIF